VVHVPTDDHGLVPEELETTIRQLRDQGKTVKLLYTIPSFHNPGGTNLPQERRDAVREICRREHLLIAEDNPYGLLGFGGRVNRAMRADDDNIVYLGSVSKMFAPAPASAGLSCRSRWPRSSVSRPRPPCSTPRSCPRNSWPPTCGRPRGATR